MHADATSKISVFRTTKSEASAADVRRHMTLSNEVALKIANKVAGEQFLHAEFLCDGASSRTWKVSHQDVSLIVRMIRSDAGRPTTYQSEFEIYKQLKLKQIPVPETLATYKDMSIDGVTSPWAVTKLIRGKALKSESLTPKVAKDLGQVLTIIHSLPVNNYGRLEEKENGIFGKQYSAHEGILARWCFGQLWPFDKAPIKRNAGYSLFSGLEERILQYEAVINSIADDENVALIHSDLRGEHVFVDNNRLSGVIDFGAAFIGAIEWEFGRLGLEFGWPDVKLILEAYISHTDRNVLPDRILLTGLVLTLYKIHRYVRESSPDYKISKSFKFLEHTLDLLDGKSGQIF